MFAVGLNLWLNFRLRLWETKTLRFLNVIWWVWIDAEVLGVLDWDYRIVEVESVDVGRQRVNQLRISVQKCPKKSSIRVGKFFGTSRREKWAHQHGFSWLFRTLLRLTVRGLFNSKSLPICIVEVESVDVGRQRVNQRRISVQKCLKKRLVFKSVPSTWLFVTFPHLVAIDRLRSL